MLALDCESRRVQSMPCQEQMAFELRCPPRLDEPQVKLFVGSVNFVAHNRMTKSTRDALEFGGFALSVELHELS